MARKPRKTAEAGPETTSGAYNLMRPEIDMIDAILGGARNIREGREIYLPKLNSDEDHDSYNRRLNCAPWRPEFEDALRGIVSRPFSKEVAIQGDTSETIRAFTEDVDRLGNNLHQFAKVVFEHGVAYGLHGILVDYPVVPNGITLADERAQGAGPYWVHIASKNLIALYTTTINGRVVVSHARIRESQVTRTEFAETTVERIRVLELTDAGPIWVLYEQDEKEDFVEVDRGTFGGVDAIPLVLYWTGKKDGDHRVKPPLLDLAQMQLELYRTLSLQDEIVTFAGAPMLTAIGMGPPEDTGPEGGGTPSLAVGPRRVLYAPPGPDGGATSWAYVQPNPGSITAIREHVQAILDDMRRLGLQPLTPRSGDVTATGSAIDGAKAHSAVEGWATSLKDALEQALVYTSQWLSETTTAEVFVHTDFGIDLSGSSATDILSARGAGEISRETFWDEWRRRGMLGPQFDPEIELGRLETEGPIDGEETDEEDYEPDDQDQGTISRFTEED